MTYLQYCSDRVSSQLNVTIPPLVFTKTTPWPGFHIPVSSVPSLPLRPHPSHSLLVAQASVICLTSVACYTSTPLLRSCPLLGVQPCFTSAWLFPSCAMWRARLHCPILTHASGGVPEPETCSPEMVWSTDHRPCESVVCSCHGPPLWRLRGP